MASLQPLRTQIHGNTCGEEPLLGLDIETSAVSFQVSDAIGSHDDDAESCESELDNVSVRKAVSRKSIQQFTGDEVGSVNN